jgi:hypothetical protein
MRVAGVVLAVWALMTGPAAAAGPGFQDLLLDRMVGEWVLRGTIRDAECTHDVVAEWVLGHQYLRFHEVAREKDEAGAPAYEALVFLGWDEPTGRYACLWLDGTGGGGLTAEGIGHAEPAEDRLAFVFGDRATSAILTTFAYDREEDAWRWLIDIDRNGAVSTFARLKMTRRESSRAEE